MRNIIGAMIPPIDVQRLLVELRSISLSDAAIGKEISAPAGTISRLRRGKHKTTTAERAVRIANLHARMFPERGATENDHLV